jgi:hypothetical protein
MQLSASGINYGMTTVIQAVWLVAPEPLPALADTVTAAVSLRRSRIRYLTGRTASLTTAHPEHACRELNEEDEEHTSLLKAQTIAAGSAATSVTLSIQTANTQRAQNEQFFPRGPVSLGFLLLPLLGMKAVRRRLRCLPSLPVALFTVVLSLCAVLGISGCSGGSSPQPTTTPTAQSYTVTVTAKDVTTGVQNSINFTLTVQ